jgi:aspartyl-tRNA(Asn)/glutamyl-tRNA(Gln) amidotransferase subunit A
VALTELFLSRLERIGPSLNAVVTLMRDSATAEARAAEREIAAARYRGPLHGIPYGLKDLCATAGVPTTWGAAPFRNQVFDRDATVVRKLREAGAVLIAKLAMVELAGGMGYNQPNASFTGPGINPWTGRHWSGGSSSGPGSAVAAGLVPYAIGSETSGSILTPCAYCGISGLRPTYGRVSRAGAMALSWTMDKLGPMGRTADDCGLVLSAISGADPEDPTAAARPYWYDARRLRERGFTIGVLRVPPESVQPEVLANFQASLEVLRQFATLVPDVELPELPYGAVTSTIINVEGAAAFQDLIENGRLSELTAPEDRTGGYPGTLIFAVDYLNALRMRGVISRRFDELLGRFDALVAPTRGNVASPLEVQFRDAFPALRGGSPLIGATNVAGVPAVCVPNGFGEGALPTGIQFVGRAWEENTLLAIANQYQRRTDWHRRRPPET